MSCLLRLQRSTSVHFVLLIVSVETSLGFEGVLMDSRVTRPSSIRPHSTHCTFKWCSAAGCSSKKQQGTQPWAGVSVLIHLRGIREESKREVLRDTPLFCYSSFGGKMPGTSTENWLTLGSPHLRLVVMLVWHCALMQLMSNLLGACVHTRVRVTRLFQNTIHIQCIIIMIN